MNPDMEFYAKTDDPVYQEFRNNIRDREAFNKKIKGIKLNDRIKIWRTNRSIEDDCKAILFKQEEKKRKEKEKINKYLYCGCLRKKKLSKAKIAWMRLASRSKQILRKKSDNHYQGFQGEPCEYNLKHKHNDRQEMFDFILFLTIFMAGFYYIMESYCPGVFGNCYKEILSVATVPSLLADFIYSVGIKVM